MWDVTTWGELMLRLSVMAGARLEIAHQLDVFAGGAEANVVSALARLGRKCGYVTALPDTPLGRRAALPLQHTGVDISRVYWSPAGRVGVYYVEYAAPPRHTEVIYDRAGSCAASMTAATIDWAYLLDTRLLHLTGISPALSAETRALTLESVAQARGRGIPISFDVNYRRKLWSPEDARAALLPMLDGIYLLICKADDAQTVFGLRGDPPTLLRALADLTGARQVVMTQGEKGAWAWDVAAGQLHAAAALPVTIIDRIGAGDAFTAGVLHGWLAGDLARGLHYGAALAALKLTQWGDQVTTTPAELERVLQQPRGGLER